MTRKVIRLPALVGATDPKGPRSIQPPIIMDKTSDRKSGRSTSVLFSALVFRSRPIDALGLAFRR